MTSRLRPSPSAASRGLEAGLDARSVGDEGRVGALAAHRRRRRVERRRRGLVDLALLPVAALRLEEDDRVVALDRLADHPVAVVRRRGRHDAQPRGVREVRLGALGVVLDGADAAAEGDAHDERQRDARPRSARAAWRPARRAGRTRGRRSRRTGSRRPGGSRGSRGPTEVPTMPDSPSGESMTRASPKSFCSPSVTRNTPPSLPMSSPEQEDLRVVLHRLAQPLVDGLGQRQLGHLRLPASSAPSSATISARSSSMSGCGSA